MNFEDLEAFILVARHGGFSRAATQRRVAQSALSKRVTRLEHHLNVRLLERHGRGVRLTEHGIALLDRASGLVAELKEIERDMLSRAEEASGEIRIALPPTTATVLAPLVLAQIRRKFPRVRLHIREGFSGAIHDWLLEGRVEIALLYNPEDSAELVITPFLREPVYLIAPADHPPFPEGTMGRGRFRLKKIGALPLVLPGPTHSLRALMERSAAEHRVALDIVTEIDGMRATKAVVEAGLGFTAFSYAGVYEEVNAGTLKTIPFTPPLYWTLAMAERRSTQISRALVEVRKAITEQVDVLRARGFWRGNPA
ncbi:LysR family transcriptional regulator [Xanthobacter flavus]|uniref:LysR family transcriptional regulator n=1 Tax=Xanthobacter flavus TaxID=281 RepID=UPI0037284C71